MKTKFIYVFLTCLVMGCQLSISAQNQVNKGKKDEPDTGAVYGTPDSSNGKNTDAG